MAYNKITLFDNVTYNYLALKKGNANEVELSTFENKDYVPKWSDLDGGILLTDFNNSLVSSYISGLPTQFTSWSIYRQKVGESTQHFVGKVERNKLYIIDYMCSNQTDYIYYVLPETDSELGVSMQTPVVTTDWWNYSLTSLTNISDNIYVADKVWIFDYNLTSTEIVQNTDVTTFKTFTDMPKITKGNNNYQTMGISCLIGGINEKNYKYEDDIKLVQEWQKFVSENKLCLWKDRKGSIKVGVITENPTTKYSDETSEQLTTITFNFVETMNPSSISVYNSEEYEVQYAYIQVVAEYGQQIYVSNIGTQTYKGNPLLYKCAVETTYTVTNVTSGKSKQVITGEKDSIINVTLN